jgi:hypothetical protein
MITCQFERVNRASALPRRLTPHDLPDAPEHLPDAPEHPVPEASSQHHPRPEPSRRPLVPAMDAPAGFTSAQAGATAVAGTMPAVPGLSHAPRRPRQRMAGSVRYAPNVGIAGAVQVAPVARLRAICRWCIAWARVRPAEISPMGPTAAGAAGPHADVVHQRNAVTCPSFSAWLSTALRRYATLITDSPRRPRLRTTRSHLHPRESSPYRNSRSATLVVASKVRHTRAQRAAGAACGSVAVCGRPRF